MIGKLRSGRQALVAAAKKWNHDILEQDADTAVRNGTRWGRAGVFLLPATLSVGALGALIVQGALATSMNVNNSAFTLKANKVSGTGFGAVLNTQNVEAADASTSKKGLARVTFASAKVEGLCGIINQSFGPLNVGLILSAGDSVKNPPAVKGPTIDAANLSIEADTLAGGNTTLYNAVLGASASKILVGGGGLEGAQSGGFGLDASNGDVSLNDLNASAYTAEITGNLSLPGLTIKMKQTAANAADCP
ncbi:hypothetical protein GCM10027589_33800 [Actinocorallia lasiicapitis]